MNFPEKTICHNFPLRWNYLAQLVVPFDLTKEDADRLCAFIRSLSATDKDNRKDEKDEVSSN
jgi:hypothetical protein